MATMLGTKQGQSSRVAVASSNGGKWGPMENAGPGASARGCWGGGGGGGRGDGDTGEAGLKIEQKAC